MKTRAKLLAGVATMLLVTGAAGAQPPTIGRLFTTPAERHQLDVQRGLLGAPPPAPAPVAEPVAAPPAPEPVTLNGFVRRSDGRNTVWVNQEAQESATFSGDPRQPRVTVPTPAGGSVTLKPGQTADLNSGRIDDVEH